MLLSRTLGCKDITFLCIPYLNIEYNVQHMYSIVCTVVFRVSLLRTALHCAALRYLWRIVMFRYSKPFSFFRPASSCGSNRKHVKNNKVK